MGIENIAQHAYGQLVKGEEVLTFQKEGGDVSWMVSNPYHGTLWTVALFSSQVESIVAYPTTDKGLEVVSSIANGEDDHDAKIELAAEAYERSDSALLMSVTKDRTIHIPNDRYAVAALLGSKLHAHANGEGWDISVIGLYLKEALTHYGESIEGSERMLS